MDTETTILPNGINQSWKEQALCDGMTEVFFGPAAERPERRVEREALARSFCRACPSQRSCLLSGRLNREHGIWGGENDEERAAAGFAPRSPSRRSVIQARDNNRQADDVPDATPDAMDSFLRDVMSEADATSL